MSPRGDDRRCNETRKGKGVALARRVSAMDVSSRRADGTARAKISARSPRPAFRRLVVAWVSRCDEFPPWSWMAGRVVRARRGSGRSRSRRLVSLQPRRRRGLVVHSSRKRNTRGASPSASRSKHPRHQSKKQTLKMDARTDARVDRSNPERPPRRPRTRVSSRASPDERADVARRRLRPLPRVAQWCAPGLRKVDFFLSSSVMPRVAMVTP